MSRLALKKWSGLTSNLAAAHFQGLTSDEIGQIQVWAESEALSNWILGLTSRSIPGASVNMALEQWEPVDTESPQMVKKLIQIMRECEPPDEPAPVREVSEKKSEPDEETDDHPKKKRWLWMFIAFAALVIGVIICGRTAANRGLQQDVYPSQTAAAATFAPALTDIANTTDATQTAIVANMMLSTPTGQTPSGSVMYPCGGTYQVQYPGFNSGVRGLWFWLYEKAGSPTGSAYETFKAGWIASVGKTGGTEKHLTPVPGFDLSQYNSGDPVTFTFTWMCP